MDGSPVPKGIADAPDLLPWLRNIYVSFVELATCRLFDEGEIPWTAIRQYAVLTGYADTTDDFDRFVTLIRAMDEAYIGWRREKLSKKGKIGKGDDKKKPPLGGKSRGRQ